MQPSRPTRFVDLVLYCMAIALFVSGALGVRDVLADPHSPARSGGRRPHLLTPPPALPFLMPGAKRILLVGADDRASRGRADAIIVAYINPRSRRAALLSIQRDTKTDIPGHRKDKINHAYRFGDVALLKRTVEGLLGHRIDRYAKLDFDTFKEAVDILGGVEVNVPDVEGRGRGMNYDDNADGLHIRLKPGKQMLDGEAAIGYVRYRRDSDLGRARRQREFLKAAARQHVRASRLPALLRAARHTIKRIDTDLSPGQAGRLLAGLCRIPPEGIMTAMLPVRNAPSGGVYYSVVDESKAAALQREVAQFLQGAGDTQKPLKECKVCVLNGSGSPGVARVAAERVRKAGAQVTSVANAESFGRRRSEIRYQAGRESAAEELRGILATPRADLCADDDFDAPGAAGIVITVGDDFRPGGD